MGDLHAGIETCRLIVVVPADFKIVLIPRTQKLPQFAADDLEVHAVTAVGLDVSVDAFSFLALFCALAGADKVDLPVGLDKVSV